MTVDFGLKIRGRSQTNWRLSIRVEATTKNEISVHGVEIAEGNNISKASFPAGTGVRDALAAELAVDIKRAVSGKSDPTFVKLPPATILGRKRVFFMRRTHRLTVRYGYCSGDKSAVFAPKFRPIPETDQRHDALAAETIEGVFVPLRNFSNQFQASLDSNGEPTLDHLAKTLKSACEKIDELDVYRDMLCDFAGKNLSTPERRTLKALSRLDSSNGVRFSAAHRP